MFLISNIKSKPMVGLHIHPDELRLLQMKKLKQGWQVEKIAVADLPKGTIVDGKPCEISQLRDSIANLVSSVHVQKYHAAIALPVNNVITKRIKLASGLSDPEYEMEIRLNLREFFPGISTDLSFDFVKINRGEDYDDFLLIATRQELLNDYVAVVNQAGLKTEIVDVDSFAMMRAINLFHVSTEAIIVLEVNLTLMHFMILQNNETLFFQQINIFALSIQEINQRIISLIQLYLTTNRNIQFNTVFLAGKFHLLEQIVCFIQGECKLKVIFANPFSGMSFSSSISFDMLSQIASRMLICCGLAMRGITHDIRN